MLIHALRLIVFFVVAMFSQPVFAKQITSAICKNFTREDLPFGDFTPPLPQPLSEMRVTQVYNTAYQEGFCVRKGGGYLLPGSPGCKGGAVLYGHDGLDLNPFGAKNGQYDVTSLTNGLVVASTHRRTLGGWGEVVIVAVRTRLSSEEVLTFHFNHLHAIGDPLTPKYWTSRRVNACEQVSAGTVLAEEGDTNEWATHLHLSVRRWSSWEKMKEALTSDLKDFNGVGYVRSKQSLLSAHLDPAGLLFNTFRDSDSQNQGVPEAQNLRSRSIEFGLYNGEFGFNKAVTRSEMARWVKIAANLDSVFPQTASFQDVPTTHPDFPYIEKLSRFPAESLQAIDGTHSCKNGGSYFCPDSSILQAEAVKMLVLGLFPNEFLAAYQWLQGYHNSVQVLNILLGTMPGIDPLAWYAPYYWFAVTGKMATVTDYANAGQPLTRSKAAVWLSRALEQKVFAPQSDCSACWNGQYCDTKAGQCTEIPVCLPQENEPCPLGGGIDKCPVVNCIPGETDYQSCPNSSSDFSFHVCESDCNWGAWTACPPPPDLTPDAGAPPPPSEDAGSPPPPPPIEDASAPPPPEDAGCSCQVGTCCDGCQHLSSDTLCSSNYEYQCLGSQPDDDSNYRLVENYCTGFSAGCDGPDQLGSWQIYQNCGPSQVCDYSGNLPTCLDLVVSVDSGVPPDDAGTIDPPPDAGQCQLVYLIDNSDGCYLNVQNVGNPTLCLTVEQISGSIFRFQICKFGGSFINDAFYELYDDNYTKIPATGTVTGGQSCSDWQNVYLDYLVGTSPQNGAGLKAKVFSPYSCQSQDCIYYTGYRTVYLECQ